MLSPAVLPKGTPGGCQFASWRTGIFQAVGDVRRGLRGSKANPCLNPIRQVVNL